jgi:hypothetical protein
MLADVSILQIEGKWREIRGGGRFVRKTAFIMG